MDACACAGMPLSCLELVTVKDRAAFSTWFRALSSVAEEKGKQKAVEQPDGPKTPEDEIEAEARRAARDRVSGWMRLRLEALLLLETVLSEAEGRLGSAEGLIRNQDQSLAAVQEDLRQVCSCTQSRLMRPHKERIGLKCDRLCFLLPSGCLVSLHDGHLVTAQHPECAM